jgi:serine/threonine protein kinase
MVQVFVYKKMFGVRQHVQGDVYKSEFEGENVNSYTKGRELGSGGYGYVHLYENNNSPSSVVAVKDVVMDNIDIVDSIPQDVYISRLFETKLPHGILDVYCAREARIVFRLNQDYNGYKEDYEFSAYEIRFPWRDYMNDPTDPKKLVLTADVEQMIRDKKNAIITTLHILSYRIDVNIRFHIFMDRCDGSIENIGRFLQRTPTETYAMLSQIAEQLSIVYSKTQMIFCDMKLLNVLYTNSPRRFYVCDFGSFYAVGSMCAQSYICPYNDVYDFLPNSATNYFTHEGYGLFSLFILLETIRKGNLNRTISNTEMRSKMEAYPNMVDILQNLKENKYVTPHNDSMHDFLARVAHPILFGSTDSNVRVHLVPETIVIDDDSDDANNNAMNVADTVQPSEVEVINLVTESNEASKRRATDQNTPEAPRRKK